ncbi:glycerate kinase [Nocardia sp. NPDC019395]|uniref:glycerate kinase n=1 Tax=Nocardia sp. NPDC019395 TaxID=3154686 RepID=UPI003411AA92
MQRVRPATAAPPVRTPTRVLIAADKFKGSMTADAVTSAIARGIEASGLSFRVSALPVADGGDGTVDAALQSGFAPVTIRTVDALGAAREVVLARDGDRILIETASICGMATMSRPAPLHGSSAGVGQAISAALDHGARSVIIGLGGSATTDGGSGMLGALGVVFRDDSGQVVNPSGATLARIAAVDWSGLDPRLAEVRLSLLCDVSNPLLGPAGAARIFGPQKGATPGQVEALERGLTHFVDVLAQSPENPIDAHTLAGTPGSGAAGGIAFGALCIGADRQSGADVMLELLRFDEHLTDTDLVVTGEGRLDAQTAGGKVPQVVTERAVRAGCTVVAVVGSSTLTDDEAHAIGFDAVYELVGRDPRCADDPALTESLLRDIGRAIAHRYRSSPATERASPH